MKVLIAVEDKEHGALMADFIKRHVWNGDCEFTVLHVIEPMLLDRTGEIAFVRFLESTAAQVRMEAKILVGDMAKTIRELCPGAKVVERVVEGHVASTILEIAKSWDSDLLIVGSHGRKGLNKFFMGSVSETITSHSPCSLVILRLPAKKAESGEKKVEVRSAVVIRRDS